jgi:hypothetical protein
MHAGAKNNEIYYKSKPLNTKSTIAVRRLSKYLILFIYVSTCQKAITTLYIEKNKKKNLNNIE